MSAEIPLYADVTLERLTNRDGGNAALPPFVLGDTKVFTLTLQERTAAGLQERSYNVRSLRASLGKVMEPSTGGFFRFRKRTETYLPQATGSTSGFVHMRGLLIESETAILLDLHEPPEGFSSFAASVAYFQNAANGAVEIEFDAAAEQITVRCLLAAAATLQVEFKDLDGATRSIHGIPSSGPGQDGPQVAFDCTPAVFAEQLADYAGTFTVAEVQKPGPGVFLVRFAEAGEAAFDVNAGELTPSSIGRVRAYQIGSVWWHEVAFIQLPAAFSGSFERVLPPAPSIERVRSGSARVPGSSANTNEVQRLHLPSNFKGSYSLTHDYRRTALIGPQDGPEEIWAHLNQLYKDGKPRFQVTNPENDFAYIEFLGPLEATSQELLTVQVHSFEPGVLTFSLFLGRPEMAALLRDRPEIELPLEIELEILDDDDDPQTAGPGRVITIAQQKVKVFREQIFAELAEIPAMDWLRPSTPRNYIPFSPLQVITGQQHYVAVIGNGVARSFSILHGLNTSAIAGFTVRENKPRGRFLVLGTDFTVSSGDDPANELVVDIPTSNLTPPANGLAVIITTAGPRSAFQDHPHPMGQITGLIDYLAAFGERLANIEDRLPFTNPGIRDKEDHEGQEIELPSFFDQFPGRFPADDFTKPQRALRPPAILPAVHNATVAALPTPLPAASVHAGKVFTNQGAGRRDIPGGLGHRGFALAPGEAIGSDGRLWYRLTRDGATNSYYPTAYERELFILPINSEQLRPGGELSVEFTASLRTMSANTRLQAVLVVEIGEPKQQTMPAPVGVNLSEITWNTTPLLSQRFIVSNQLSSGKFGAAVRRGLDNVLTADRKQYGMWSASSTGPTSANFVLRCRLLQIDTENAPADARGSLWVAMTEGKATISNADQPWLNLQST